MLAIIALLLYIVLPQIGGLKDAGPALMAADKADILTGVALLLATYVVSAAILQPLAIKPLLFGRTLLVQAANGLAGKLLPAGLGGIGLNAAYLKRQGHTLPEATAVAGANNVVGFMGYLILLALAVLLLGVSWPHVSVPGHTVTIIVTVVALVAVIGALIFGKRGLTAVRRALSGLSAYRKHPTRLIGALVMAAVLPALFSAILYYVARALGLPLSAGQAFAVFSAGQFVGSVTPTPGGVVGAEAGISGALVAYGVNGHNALLTALLYRLITYWLPMLPGGIALLVARTRRIV